MSMVGVARAAAGSVTRHADLALVVLVVAVIALMIVPLPTPLVDLLISANLSISFVILMMTMYTPTVLSFSSFPTLLLFTTLFRLGLNIATTRLILLQADAGEIIFTFGEFAVGGNFVVGAVVFIIIAVIQFLVIAKGAERVSEVGARFSLDAMPGKQMSIDADLRAGSIDGAEAQRRRDEVGQESKMYGAMDGAMKFVKGDAIAGLIVAAVNIVAGTIIGSTTRGLSASESLQLYGVLTIGDGLVSQIPSLLISISAGILVTRAGGRTNNVGEQIGGQIFSQPKAMKVAGALVFIFALVPGFPKPQLFSLAFLLFGIGYGLQKMSCYNEEDPHESISRTLAPTVKSKTAKPSAAAQQGDDFTPVVPIILDISPALEEQMDYAGLDNSMMQLRSALYFDLGVPFPGINLREAPALTGLEYVLNLDEIPVSHGVMEAGKVLVREDADNVRMLGIEVTQGAEFLPGGKSLWIDKKHYDSLKKVNMACLNYEEIITLHLSMLLSRHAGDFIGLQETKYLLDRMEERAPDLVHEATRLLPLQKVADMFKRLVQEQISIRDLRTILEAIIAWAPKEKDIIMLCEYIRTSLKRQISFKYTAGQNILPVVLLDPKVEELIRKSIRQTSAGAFLALDPESSKKFVQEVRRIRQSCKKEPALIASIDIRRYVRRLIEAEFYEIPVLDYQELTPEVSVQPVDRIRF
ncbi:MAG: type III secretion system export apparatus subunit SctV [Succinivibrio sp.]|nr:type III secretion system export apparatus subunit SctV [Succinivibrio sp.]